MESMTSEYFIWRKPLIRAYLVIHASSKGGEYARCRLLWTRIAISELVQCIIRNGGDRDSNAWEEIDGPSRKTSI